MSPPITSPIRLIRSAVMTQLADPAIGLNPNLAASCAAYNVPAFSLNFSNGSPQNVFESQIDYAATEDSGVPARNMLAVYGFTAIPFGGGSREKLLNARWSGRVAIRCDLFLGVLGEIVRSFEPWADAGEDALVATFNQPGAGQTNFSGGGKLYGLEIASQRFPARTDGENWVIPVRLTATFEAYIS